MSTWKSKIRLQNMLITPLSRNDSEELRALRG